MFTSRQIENPAICRHLFNPPEDEEEVGGVFALPHQAGVERERLLLQTGGQLLLELGLPVRREREAVDKGDLLPVFSCYYLFDGREF